MSGLPPTVGEDFSRSSFYLLCCVKKDYLSYFFGFMLKKKNPRGDGDTICLALLNVYVINEYVPHLDVPHQAQILHYQE